MTVFGDYEPEDAWDADDPPAEQVRNLRRRLALLFSDEAVGGDLIEELDVIERAVTVALARHLTDRDLDRAASTLADIQFVRTRL